MDKTRDFIAAYNRRDFAAAVEFFDPEIEWVLPALQRSDSCRGSDEVKRFWEGLDETFEELRPTRRSSWTPATGWRCGSATTDWGKESGVEIETEMYHQVTTFRDGAIVRIEYVTSWPEALEAAGLPSKR